MLRLSQQYETLQNQKLIVSGLNKAIVQILKVDWPHHWKNFIPEIVEASKKSESVCSNSLKILGALSDEVFEFSSGQLTAAKTKELKNSLIDEFHLIYQLCDFIMSNSQNGQLLLSTLATLEKYFSWIPVGYIFETPLVPALVEKYLPVPEFRNLTLKCLTEVALLDIPGEGINQRFEQLYVNTLKQIINIIPRGTDLRIAYKHGSEEQQHFIENLAQFLTGFFLHHRTCLEKDQHITALLTGHEYLVGISTVDQLEVFKICLEYWKQLAEDLYNESPISVLNRPTQTPRRLFYAPVLSRVRSVVISRMAKPEEVIVIEDDNGHAIREVMKDGEAMERYHLMQKTLVYLTHLDYQDTQTIMLDKLANQVNGSQWSFKNLNSLCWAIGSIAESQPDEIEKPFLVTVIRDLLTLVELKRGKDNKAIVASNIMYIVGQHSRFLRAHYRFLTTVLNKLFEFMHESHDGVQDMVQSLTSTVSSSPHRSCDTFLKIVKRCRQALAVPQEQENETFCEQLLGSIGIVISDLNESQIQTFYEGVAIMISAHSTQKIPELVSRLMQLPNQTWQEIVNTARSNPNVLADPPVQRTLANILRTNIRVCSAIGPYFIHQLGSFYMDVLNVCKFFSEQITNAVQQNPTLATKTSTVKNMRAVKKETLRLVTTFITTYGKIGENLPSEPIVQNLLPPLLPAVLEDYRHSVPDGRDPGALTLMAAIATTCKTAVVGHIGQMFDCVFEPTLSMITGNFHEFPEIRVEFYNFLLSVTKHCFPALRAMQPPQLKLYLQSIIWAVKHTQATVSGIGLRTLINFLQQVAKSAYSDRNYTNTFYASHWIGLLEEILYVLTDTFHKADFKLHCKALIQLIFPIESNLIAVPLWQGNADPAMTNARFIREHTAHLLAKSFPNFAPEYVHQFVVGLFDLNRDLESFQTLLRDFLVQIQEFSGGDDNARLYLTEEEEARHQREMAERRVPGLVQQ